MSAAAGRRFLIVNRPQASLYGPCLDQRSAHGEMLVRQEPRVACLFPSGGEEGSGKRITEQSLAILRESGRVPDRLVQVEPDKPAEQ